MKTIHFFGDSWTRGDGSQFEPGSGIIPPHIKYSGNSWENEIAFHSFPTQVGNKFDMNYNIINYGSSGASNFQIYRQIMGSVKESKINKNDLVIITWTSIIREPLSFLFMFQTESMLLDSGGVENSIKGFFAENTFHPYWLTDAPSDREKNLAEKVYTDFIVDRINFDFLYEITMNYICNLQVLFDELGVKYLFINAFENVISKDIKFYNKINKEKWLLFESTLSDYLCDIEEDFDISGGYSVWEDDFIKPGRNLDGPHPNRIGYGYIAELIYNEIVNKKLL